MSVEAGRLGEELPNQRRPDLTLVAIGEAARTAAGAFERIRERSPIHVSALLIHTAIRAGFGSTYSLEESLDIVTGLQEVFIPINECADIGISADLASSGGCRQDQFVGLLRLRNELDCRFREARDDFLQTHTNLPDGTEGVINCLYDDAIMLSQIRGLTSKDNINDFKDLDSAMYVCAFLHALNPRAYEEVVNESVTRNLVSDEEKLDYLRDKYKTFLISEEPDLNESQRIARGIHAFAMLLKVEDDLYDLHDDGIDRLLGIPNYNDYLSGEEIGILKEKYLKAVRDAGINGLAISVVDRVWRVFSSRKTKKKVCVKDLEGVDPLNTKRVVGPGYTSVLRHRLRRADVLRELFDRGTRG